SRAVSTFIRPTGRPPIVTFAGRRTTGGVGCADAPAAKAPAHANPSSETTSATRLTEWSVALRMQESSALVRHAPDHDHRAVVRQLALGEAVALREDLRRELPGREAAVSGEERVE